MKKKSAIIMISITILTSLAGCRLTNIDDVYSMSERGNEKATIATSVNGESISYAQFFIYFTVSL